MHLMSRKLWRNFDTYDRFQNSFSSLSYCQMAFRKRALLNQQIMEKQRLQVKKWIGRIKEERMSNV